MVILIFPPLIVVVPETEISPVVETFALKIAFPVMLIFFAPIFEDEVIEFLNSTVGAVNLA